MPVWTVIYNKGGLSPDRHRTLSLLRRGKQLFYGGIVMKLFRRVLAAGAALMMAVTGMAMSATAILVVQPKALL